MNKTKNKSKLESIIYWITLSTLIFSIFYIAYRIAVSPSESLDPSVRTKSSYTLMFAQCILGVIAIHLPDIFEKKVKYEIPSFMVIMYIIFLYCAIYLGEVRSFYYNVTNWDTYLHTFSGAMLGALGFSFVTIINRVDKIPAKLSPFFVAFFAFAFAITLGVVWEFYEYTFDGILGLNMQKFMLEDGTQLIGREALSDTMSDLFVDALGALIVSVIGYISLKYNTNFINKLHFKKVIDDEKEKKKN